MNHFVMLVGLPGSGKSTFAKRIVDNYISCKLVHGESLILSSDEIREELYGDASIQDNPEQVFKIMYDRTVNFLNTHEYNLIVYDATNINRKHRVELLNNLDRDVENEFEKECIVVYTNIDTCKQRNENRDRKVPSNIIDRMLQNFELPVYGEGWNKIKVEYTTKPRVPYLNAVNYFVGQESHDNPHHNMDIDLHMFAALDYFINNYEFHNFDIYLKYAILFHDIGKKFCKIYKNRKGEITEIAHYYQHANVGAYLSLDIDFTNFKDVNHLGFVNEFTDEDKYNMAILINYHMRPLEAWKDSSKSKRKDMNLLGEHLGWYLEILSECDKHSESDEFVEKFLEYGERYRTINGY